VIDSCDYLIVETMEIIDMFLTGQIHFLIGLSCIDWFANETFSLRETTL